MLVRLVDDLLQGEQVGYPTVDHSRRVGDLERDFLLKVVLLYICADCPGLADISGFGGYANSLCQCHWCWHKTPQFLPSRASFLGNSDSLPLGHPLRVNSYETHPPPKLRTHDESVAQVTAKSLMN
jgi:hypothetical protein